MYSKMTREEAVKELKAVFKLLSDDVEEIRQYGQSNKSDFAHRTMFRTHFAFIEGMTFQLKQVALSFDAEHSGVFSSEEISMLKDESYSLNKKGEIKSKENFQRLLPTLLFAIKCYTRIHGAAFTPNIGHHGWEALGKYLNLRNQLMHPKSARDLEINSDKARIAIDAAAWFKATLQDMFNACNSADEKI